MCQRERAKRRKYDQLLQDTFQDKIKRIMKGTSKGTFKNTFKSTFKERAAMALQLEATC